MSNLQETEPTDSYNDETTDLSTDQYVSVECILMGNWPLTSEEIKNLTNSQIEEIAPCRDVGCQTVKTKVGKLNFKREFVRYRERNPVENETWNWYLQYNGNGVELGFFYEAIKNLPYVELDMENKIPEKEVNVLVKHSDRGYLTYHNKMTGYFSFVAHMENIIKLEARKTILNFLLDFRFDMLERTESETESRHRFVRLDVDPDESSQQVLRSKTIYIRWEDNEDELHRLQYDIDTSPGYRKRLHLNLDTFYRYAYVNTMCESRACEQVDGIIHYSKQKVNMLEDLREEFLANYLSKGGIEKLFFLVREKPKL